MHEILPLHNLFRESAPTEAARREAEGRDHRHDPEISQRKETCQNDVSADLHSDATYLSGDGHAGTPRSRSQQRLAVLNRAEIAIPAEGVQRFTRIDVVRTPVVDPALIQTLRRLFACFLQTVRCLVARFLR